MLSTTYCAQNYAGIIGLGLLYTNYCIHKYTLLYVEHIQARTHAQTYTDTHVAYTQTHTYKYSYTVLSHLHMYTHILWHTYY